MNSKALLTLFAFYALLCPVGSAQEVVAAQSGVIHYSEGAVLIDDAPLDRKPATFPLLKDGSVLRTQKGRVELMLTSGTFLRLDENSSVKMLSSALTSTSVEFLHGSAILDGLAAQGEIPVVLRFKDASIRFSKPGVYRIDSETEVFQAYSGEATVEQHEKKTAVDPARLYFFELATDTKKFSDGADDEFLDWARNRNQVITAENQASQADDDENADANLGALPPLSNYNVPYGGLSARPGFPVPTNPYPYTYGGLPFNSYASAPFWSLPPLPSPLIVAGPHWAYRTHSPAWPRSATWASHHVPPSATWAASPRPAGAFPHLNMNTPRPSIPRSVQMYSHPGYTHPMTAPRAPVAAHRLGR